MIVDAAHWRQHLPQVVEAVWGDAAVHQAFLRAYDLTEKQVPLVAADFEDWHKPFKKAASLQQQRQQQHGL